MSVHALGRWKQTYRYAEVTAVCLPLVMSMAATTVMEFTDRVFLSNYSLDAISAATPAGIAAFLIIAFFGGVAGFTSVFIAQYCGAGADTRVGAALWQGLYFSLFAGVLSAAGVSLLAKPLFLVAGHAPEVQRLEIIYFKILGWGSMAHIANNALSGFFAGRGITRPVMLVNALGMAFNIPLDYALINGVWIFPELGITGAALATVASWGLITLLFSALIFTRTHQERYWVGSMLYDAALFKRLLRFGVPGALQFSLDIFAFTVFIFMVGRIGKNALAVSNMVISINSLAFMPAMGFSYGVSALTGQALGRGRPGEARLSAVGAIHILLAYTLIVDLVFIFAPGWVLSLFMPADPSAAALTALMNTGRPLLRIVAAYIFMDALYMVFSGVLKGAGDTHFIMYSIGFASVFLMILPIYIGVEWLHMDIYFAWLCVLIFIAALFVLTGLRYRQGKWQHMRVVERDVLV